MDEQALELDYNLLISGSHNRVEDTLSAFRMMKGRVDGFMVVPHNIELAVLSDMTPRGIPAIFLHSPDPKGVYQTLCISNFKGAYQATQHLIELGHRDIAFIKGPDVNPEAQERLRGYRRALVDAGLPSLADREFPGDFSYNSGLRAARLVLQCQPAPTAIFACNDRMAIGVLRVLHGAGRHVPDDVAVIGFDDIPSALYVTPMLSTVRVPFYHMGRRAVQLLVERLNNEEKTTDKMVSEVFPTRLIPRTSTIGVAYQSDRAYQHISSN
jgi:LacI family transcriptional regulator